MNISPLIEYFAAEKNASILLLGLAIASVTLGLYLYLSNNPFRAMLWVLFTVGTIQAVVGVGLLTRTPGQVSALRDSFTHESPRAVTPELQRMQKVNRSWLPLKVVEALLILLGLLFVLWPKSSPGLQGVGMGLILQASVMLSFDLFAEHRALEYTAWLAKQTAAPL